MSTITLTSNGISGDFEILFDDETVGANALAGMRMLRRTSGATETVHTTQALYSAVADKSDEFLAMGFKNPMLPVTPNAFTMENNYFIPRSSTEYLKEGAIDADWSVSSGDGVYMKAYGAVSAAFVPGDIGLQITETDSGDTGTLLDYETLPDGTTVVWIRPDAAGDTFADVDSQLEVTSDSGAGDVTATAAAISGQSLWPSAQVIGSVPTATEVYIYQDRQKMTSYDGSYQWWATDPSLSLGIIDVLVRVITAGVSVADGDLEVFSRRYSSLFDNFRLNIAAGGRSALPLASAPDINNTTGYRTFTGSAGSNTFNAGNAIYVGASWAAATKKGVLTAVGGTVGAPDLAYYLIGDLTDFVNSDAVKEYDFSTELDGDATCTAGTPAANSGGPTDSASGEGGSVTVTLGTIAADHDGDGTNEYYSVDINAQNNVPIAKVYERIKYITRRGADETDLFGSGVEVPGESYRGLDGLFEYDASTGAMTQGDNVLTTTGGNTWTARLASQNTASTPDYITVMDQQTSLDSVIDDNVIEDEAGGDDVTVHAGGTLGLQTFTSPKASPFGTFTGTQIFGARGVLFKNFAPADTQAYILIDDTGAIKQPPNTVAFVMTNSVAGDRLFAARDTGIAGVIDKDQFGGMAAPAGTYNGIGDQVIRAAGTVDVEVPPAGYIRVVENTKQEEHKYHYASRTTGALGEFTLISIPIGTADSGTSTTALVDAAGDFVNDGVVPGMLIRDTTNGDFYEVVTVTDANNLVIQQIFGTGGVFADTDGYEINRLIQDYATGDDLFDLLLDIEADDTSESNSFVKTLASDFTVVVHARNGKDILPFAQNQLVGDSGASVTIVRTADTIAT